MDDSKPALVELLEKCLICSERYRKDGESFLNNLLNEKEYKDLASALKNLALTDVIGSKSIAEVYIPGKIHGFTVIDSEDIAVSVFCLSAGRLANIFLFFAFSLYFSITKCLKLITNFLVVLNFILTQRKGTINV
jgi:hypothetical protein